MKKFKLELVILDISKEAMDVAFNNLITALEKAGAIVGGGYELSPVESDEEEEYEQE